MKVAILSEPSRSIHDPAARSEVAKRFKCLVGSFFFVLAACSTMQPAATASLESNAPFAAEIARFVAFDRASPPPPCKVLFVGSSSIALWQTLSTDMQPIPVINRGFGGSQISDVNFWFDQVVVPYRPRAIVFYAGENDIDAGKSPETVATDFETFMARKAQALGDRPVYFISLKPSKLRFDQLARQSLVNELVRNLAGQRGDLHFLDITGVMLDQGQPKDLYMPDNVHMRPEGYALWTEVVRAALLPETEQQAKLCRQPLKH